MYSNISFYFFSHSFGKTSLFLTYVCYCLVDSIFNSLKVQLRLNVVNNSNPTFITSLIPKTIGQLTVLFLQQFQLMVMARPCWPKRMKSKRPFILSQEIGFTVINHENLITKKYSSS